MKIHGGSPPLHAHDYSAPGNPLGPPPWLHELLAECIERRVHLRYPDPAYRGLREAIAAWHGIDAREVSVFDGSAEALAELPLLLRAAGVAVLEPTFGDHAAQAPAADVSLARIVAWRRRGRRFELDAGTAEAVAREGWLVLTSNPNNPTGGVVDPGLLEELGAAASRRGSMLVVDEAFADLSPGYRLVSPGEGLVATRSLTKSFSTPGLRAGYVYAEARIASRLEAVRQPWPVSSLAACVYEALLSEERSRWWVSRARLLVSREAPRLAARLEALGLEAHESRTPFILVRHPRLPNPVFREALAARGVYIRDASSFHGLGPVYSRIAIRTPGENDALLEALGRLSGHA